MNPRLVVTLLFVYILNKLQYIYHVQWDVEVLVNLVVFLCLQSYHPFPTNSNKHKFPSTIPLNRTDLLLFSVCLQIRNPAVSNLFLYLQLAIIHFSTESATNTTLCFCNSCVKKRPAPCNPACVRQHLHPWRHSQTGGKQHNYQVSPNSKCLTGSEFRNSFFHQQLARGVMNVSSSVSLSLSLCCQRCARQHCCDYLPL